MSAEKSPSPLPLILGTIGSVGIMVLVVFLLGGRINFDGALREKSQVVPVEHKQSSAEPKAAPQIAEPSTAESQPAAQPKKSDTLTFTIPFGKKKE